MFPLTIFFLLPLSFHDQPATRPPSATTCHQEVVSAFPDRDGAMGDEGGGKAKLGHPEGDREDQEIDPWFN